MSQYNIVISTDESTVVAEYNADGRKSSEYQSEADLEKEFIRLLTEQAYERLLIKNEADLVSNLRLELEELNKITFSDAEWEQFFNKCIASDNEGIVDKTRKIRDDHIQILRRDDGSTKNIFLIDKRNIHNNRLQIINQYEEDGGTHKTRYDVTILVADFLCKADIAKYHHSLFGFYKRRDVACYAPLSNSRLRKNP